MPELPEVERSRRLLERHGVGHTITDIHCTRDSIVFADGASASKVSRALRGRLIRHAHRRGKHLILEFDRPPFLLIHLGMTGGVWAQGEKPLKLRSSSSVESIDHWPPRFLKMHLTLDTGIELAVTNKRRLGRIRLRNDPWNTEPISALGFDPLIDLPTVRQLGARLSKRSGPIKAVLIDQSFAAGVGNWIADEVLYQAKISPKRRASALDADETRRLRTKLRYVCRTAVDRNAEVDEYPRTWLFHCRWDQGDTTTSPKGEHVRRETIGGRTTAWVPSVQR